MSIGYDTVLKDNKLYIYDSETSRGPRSQLLWWDTSKPMRKVGSNYEEEAHPLVSV